MTRSGQDIVPACTARTFEVSAGQRFRIVAHEGPQVCDAVFIGGEDHSETYCSDVSVLLNQLKGIGNLWRIKELYSRPPNMKRMLTVTEDRIKHHFPWAGGMCSSLLYEIRNDDPHHPNCADNLFESLIDFGLDLKKVPEVFNIGMNVTIRGDTVEYEPPEYSKGDFIEFEADMDLVMSLSACPNDTTVMNEFHPKALKVEWV